MFARFSALSVSLLALVYLFSSASLGQEKQFKGGGKGGKGGGGFMMKPEDQFSGLAKGRDYFLVSEVEGKRQESLVQFAKDQGITDGKITLDAYLKYNEERMKKFQQMFGGKGFGGKGGDGKAGDGKGFKGFAKGGDKGKGPGGRGEKPAAPLTDDELTKMAEAEFKKRDEDMDGMLNFDEMDSVLKRELIHWDTNKDEVIDLKEYVAYYVETKKKEQELQKEKQAGGGDTVTKKVIEVDDLDVRPVVLRRDPMTGKFPMKLPAWFDQLDGNKDGLVSLAEWRKGGKTIEDFQKIDRNDDGLLTPEEALRSEDEAKGLAGDAKTASAKDGPNGGGPGAGTFDPAAFFRGMGQGGQGQGNRFGGKGGGKGKRGGGKRGGGTPEE